MAWVTEYDMRWENAYGGYGYIYLQRDEGTYQRSLKLRDDSFGVTTNLPGWEDQVVRQSCSFTIVNDGSNWYDLLPLMTISNGQIRVVAGMTSPTSETLFIGFLNCEIIDQELLHNSDLNFTASGLLNKLQYDHPTEIDTLQNLSLIDILDACLTMTGQSYNIYVDISLAVSTPDWTPPANTTVFNNVSVFSEVFWTDNVQRMSALEIIETILKPLNCYLYWYDEGWYIQHYQDMGNVSSLPFQKTFIRYTTGTSYGRDDPGTAVTETLGAPLEVHTDYSNTNRYQVSETQRLSIIPGMKQIEIQKEQLEYYNLIDTYMYDFTQNATHSSAIRAWKGYEATESSSLMYWTDFISGSFSFMTIANAQNRVFYDITTGADELNGLITTFKYTAREDSELTIDFSFGTSTGDPPESSIWTSPEDWEIKFYWFLRWKYQSTPIPLYQYFVYEESAGSWNTVNGVLTPNASTQSNILVLSAEEMTITGGPGTWRGVLSGTMNVPIGEILSTSAGYEEDMEISFGLGHEFYDNTGSGGSTNEPGDGAAFGDFKITSNSAADDNIIRGDLNTDFLNKLTIPIKLFDGSYDYRNTLLIGAVRTEDWDYGGSEVDLLENWLLTTKFRLYNVARQRIAMDYVYLLNAKAIRPLFLFEDGNQSDKPFILHQDIYYPQKATHSVVLAEYDDSTTITLV